MVLDTGLDWTIWFRVHRNSTTRCDYLYASSPASAPLAAISDAFGMRRYWHCLMINYEAWWESLRLPHLLISG